MCLLLRIRRLQFGLQFNAVRRRTLRTDRARWSSLNGSEPLRPELLMRLRFAARAADSLSTVVKAIASYRRRTTALEHRASGQPLLDSPGQSAHSYGSDAPRRKRVPDRAVNQGNSWSLPARPTPHPSWDGPVRQAQANDLLSSKSTLPPARSGPPGRALRQLLPRRVEARIFHASADPAEDRFNII